MLEDSSWSEHNLESLNYCWLSLTIVSFEDNGTLTDKTKSIFILESRYPENNFQSNFHKI